MHRCVKPVLMTPLLFLQALAWGAPAASTWDHWLAHDPVSTQVVDHGAWQQFLDAYLVAGPDGINRLDYRLAAREGHDRLRDYLNALSDIDPRRLTRDEQMAYWINLYNALTVDVVLRNPGKGSILRMGKGLFSIGPWDDELLVVAGQPITLNDVEHRILRPIWRDHRIHYAVNCASLGCPDLSARAYTGATVEQQLADAEDTFVNHSRAVSFSAGGKLRLSSIYKWYRRDFAQDKQALLDYLAMHHRAHGPALSGYRGSIAYRYDWKLNRHPPEP